MRLNVSGAGVFALAFAALFASVDLSSAADAVVDATPRHDLLVAADTPKSQGAAHAGRTRFVIGLDRKVEFLVSSLSNPNRVVIELPDVNLRLPEFSGDKQVGVVKSFRGGLAAPGKARIVIDVSEPVIVDGSKLERDAAGGFRLAIDIMPFAGSAKDETRKPLSTAPFGLGGSGLQPPLPKPAENPRKSAARAFKPTIVLDPGHGGDDSGAMKFGTVEKQVVLAFGHVLRKQLEKTGRYKVMMTRETDVFVPLGERVEFGERNSANLFIAIHADYAKSSARGATIFSLRDGVAKSLQRSAKGSAARNVLSESEIANVRGGEGDVDTVREMLSDFAQRQVESTHDRSELFSRSVIETMGEQTPMRNEPDQQAAFRVLKTAQFPSVLIELAYVTNREDADNLESNEWREKVADSIVSAIDTYFSTQVANLPM